MQRIAQRPGGLRQRVGNVPIRHGGELDRGILQTGVLKANSAGSHHDIPGLHIQINTAAGAGADKRVRAALMQLLHGNGGGGTANTGGAGRDLLSQQRAGPDIVFPVIGHLMRVLKQCGNGRHPARVAGQNAVTADVLGSAADMELFF